jgi:Arc/MetJ-type ribon-helix-helix transcriptional regulator
MKQVTFKELLEFYSNVLRGEQTDTGAFPSISERMRAADRLIEIVTADRSEEKKVVIIDKLPQEQIIKCAEIMGAPASAIQEIIEYLAANTA